MNLMDTLELTLQHQRAGTWPVVAELSRPGELARRCEGRLVLPPGCADLEGFAVALTERLDRPRDYGTLLGEALFQGAIRDAFVAARSGAGAGGLRVLLVIEDPELRPLRWERLCAPDGTGGWDFLALDQSTPYSRYLPSLTDRRFPAIGRRDLRALVVLADPPPDNPYGLAPFEAGPTAEAIATALGEIPHDRLGPLPGALGPASLDALTERITTGGYTLLHLLAHGAVRPDGETVVYLLDAAGAVAPVTGSDLIRRLGRVGANRGLPHLVFLATCEGAKPEAETALGGLAQRLVRELGIPAVVAMTERVSIETAGALATAFYARLRERGEPDLALVEAGAALQGRGDIGVPALFERLAGRPLFSDRLEADRPLTPAEIGFGLERLGALLAERAPVLRAAFDEQARVLRAGLATDTGALSPAARAEREQALDGLDALAQEALDLSFPALALDQPVPDWDGRCPFPGLKAFQREEQTFFFGREALVATLTARLRAERFLAVLGASGSGKSSLVLAGLVPGFGAGEAARGWRPARTGPHPHPGRGPRGRAGPGARRAADRRARHPAGGRSARGALHPVRRPRPPRAVRRGAGRRLAGPAAPLRGADDARGLLGRLRPLPGAEGPDAGPSGADRAHGHRGAARRHGAAGRGGGAALRGGSEPQHPRRGGGRAGGHAAAATPVAGALAPPSRALAARERVPRPGGHPPGHRPHGRRDLCGAARRPGRPAAPARALRAPHPARRDRVGARAVPRHPPARRVARRSPRRAATRSACAPWSSAWPMRASWSPPPTPRPSETQVEVSHEALIRHWPRLRGWLDEDRASWILLAAVRQQAQDWHAGGEQDADLPRWGERLQAAQSLFAQPRFAPTETERRFVHAARDLDARERAEKEQQQRERLAALEQAATASREKAEAQELAARQARGRARVAWIGTGVAATLLAVAVFLGFESNRARNDAVRAQQAAEEQSLEARYQTANVYLSNALGERDDDPLRAAHHFARAAKAFTEADRPRRAENALLALGYVNDRPRLLAVLGHEDGVTSASWSADGLRILTSSNDRSAGIWDTRTGEPTTKPMSHDDRVLGAVFTPDQSRVLTWSWDGSARLWDAETGGSLGRPMEHNEPVYGATFNGDGSLVLTRSGDKTARLWDGHTGTPVDPPLTHGRPVRGALFSPDDSRILTWSDDGTARIWNAETRQAVTPPLEHGEPVGGGRFAGDGNLVLTWSQDGGPRVWDADSGAPRNKPAEGEIAIRGADFDGRGVSVLTWPFSGNTAQLRSAMTGEAVTEIGHLARVVGGRLADDGWRALTWDQGGGIRVLDLNDHRAFNRGEGLTLQHPHAAKGARWSRDGARILSWSSDGGSGPTRTSGGLGTARVWDARTGAPLTPPFAHSASVSGAEFSPDGGRVLTWSDDGTARIWDASPSNTPRLGDATEDAGLDPSSGSEANAIGIRTDATGLRVYDSTGKPLSPPLALTREATDLINDGELVIVDPGAESPRAVVNADQALVVTWDDSPRARRWDAKSGRELAPALIHDQAVRGAAFSPEGQLVVTWSRDNTARVWDARSGRPIAPALRHEAPVNGAQFSADGARVLIWSSDGTARTWDAATGAALSPPLGHPRGTLKGYRAVMEAHFDNNGARVTTRDEGGTVRIWDLPLDLEWPIDALGQRLEAETGTAMSATGELPRSDPGRVASGTLLRLRPHPPRVGPH